MIIYSIVVCSASSYQPLFLASKTKDHQKTILDNRQYLAALQQDFIYEFTALPSSQYASGTYYIFRDSDRIVIVACNEKMTDHEQYVLQEKLKNISDKKQLWKLLDSQTLLKSELEQQYEQTKQKMDAINHELEETKHILENDIEQLRNRGEKLEDLEIRTEELRKGSEKFKKQAKKLRRSYQCPTFFSIFQSVKTFVWDNAIERMYPTNAIKPK